MSILKIHIQYLEISVLDTENQTTIHLKVSHTNEPLQQDILLCSDISV